MKRINFDVFLYFGMDVCLKFLLVNMKMDNYKFVVFLVSEDWGERQDILDEYGDVVIGLIMFKFEIRLVVIGFDIYLQDFKFDV